MIARGNRPLERRVPGPRLVFDRDDLAVTVAGETRQGDLHALTHGADQFDSAPVDGLEDQIVVVRVVRRASALDRDDQVRNARAHPVPDQQAHRKDRRHGRRNLCPVWCAHESEAWFGLRRLSMFHTMVIEARTVTLNVSAGFGVGR